VSPKRDRTPAPGNAPPRRRRVSKSEVIATMTPEEIQKTLDSMEHKNQVERKSLEKKQKKLKDEIIALIPEKRQVDQCDISEEEQKCPLALMLDAEKKQLVECEALLARKATLMNQITVLGAVRKENPKIEKKTAKKTVPEGEDMSESSPNDQHEERKRRGATQATSLQEFHHRSLFEELKLQHTQAPRVKLGISAFLADMNNKSDQHSFIQDSITKSLSDDSSFSSSAFDNSYLSFYEDSVVLSGSDSKKTSFTASTRSDCEDEIKMRIGSKKETLPHLVQVKSSRSVVSDRRR
jgi:hypothetical protein